MPLAYTTVIGRFLRSIPAVDPDDPPVLVPIVGLNLTFSATLSPPQLLDLTIVPDPDDPPAFIEVSPTTATTDVDGDISVDGHKGVILVAGDNPDFSPVGWTYKVSIVGTDYPLRFFYFFAPGGQTIDLVTVPHPPNDLGTDLLIWQAAINEFESLIQGLHDRLVPSGGTVGQVLTRTSLPSGLGWAPAGGAGAGIEYFQTVPASVWGPVPVPPGLGRRPNVMIFFGDERVIAPLEVSETEVSAVFPSPQTGSMVIN